MKYGSKISLLVTYSLPRPSLLNLFHMLPVCFNVFCVFVCLLVCLFFLDITIIKQLGTAMNVLQGSCYSLRDEFTLLGYNYLASQ